MTEQQAAKAGGRRAGSTLVELSVVVVVTGVLASLAVPTFRRSVEQTRLDQAAANLRTLWAAERFYRLENGRYAVSLAELKAADLISDDLSQLEWDGTGEGHGPARFGYRISIADDGNFQATATRLPVGDWSGTLAVDQAGVFLEGSEISCVEGDGTIIRLEPAYLLRGGP